MWMGKDGEWGSARVCWAVCVSSHSQLSTGMLGQCRSQSTRVASRAARHVPGIAAGVCGWRATEGRARPLTYGACPLRRAPALRAEAADAAEGNPATTPCEQCGGKQVIPCPMCNGTGTFALEMMGQSSACQCRLCQGRKITACPSCMTQVYGSVVWWDKQEEDPESGDGKINWGGKPPFLR
ncbi:hypothetical protein FVE85_3573 [Porphyridium purpureum]|uniref:Uncharacterized protein n=1 Tax=Porphyridium purpureum TaxID=35688 RepID=A0A5J4YLW0_PORPP|nr:hypothetical protein FVE85_3573 [Porphyridium purpureum]|eukprot:POR8503..scf249_10